MKQQKIYVLDSSAMRKMIEGDIQSEMLLNKLYQMKQSSMVITTLSSFLNAIMLSKPNVIVKNIQKILKVVKINNDEIDYTNSIQVKNRLIRFIEQSKGI